MDIKFSRREFLCYIVYCVELQCVSLSSPARALIKHYTYRLPCTPITVRRRMRAGREYYNEASDRRSGACQLILLTACITRKKLC
jgi:hypothetical protein